MRVGLAVLAALVVLLVVACLALYTPDRKASWLAARYVAADDQFITMLGVRLRVRISGPADAPVVMNARLDGVSTP